MKKLLLLLFMLAIVKIEAQQNRGIEKTDIRRGQTQRSIENDTLKNANPNKSAKLIVPVAIDKGLRQGITTPKQTQGATFGEKVNQGLHAAGSAQSNGAPVDTLKRVEKTKKHTVETNNSSKRMDNGAVVDTLKRAHLKKLADELVNKADIKKDTIKPSAKAEVRGWDPKVKSTISKTRIKPDLDSKENMKIETGVINSGETVDIKKNKIDVIKGTANQSNERATGNLKNMYPPGSKTKTSRFKSFDEIENFTWELIGAVIQNAVYVITITRIGNNQQPQQTYAATTTNSEISAKKVAKFKAGKALADTVKRTGNPNQGEDGEYQWTVAETTTGISSEPSFFTISDKVGDIQGYDENSAMLAVKIDQSSLRNTNTVMDSDSKLLSDKRDARMGIRALQIRDARHGIRASRRDARIKGAKMNDARIKTASNNDERIKTARSNDERIKTARNNDERIKDARMSARTDKRYEDVMRTNTELRDQPIEIITDEDFKVAPQTDIDTKYLRIKNNQNVQIHKGSLQLIAPMLSVQNTNDIVTYVWTVINNDQNMEQSFSGNSINYDFSRAGTYGIEITPTLNEQKLRSYRVLVIVK